MGHMMERCVDVPVDHGNTDLLELAQQQLALHSSDAPCQLDRLSHPEALLLEGDRIRADHDKLVLACPQPDQHRQISFEQRADQHELRPGREDADGHELETFEGGQIGCLGTGQRAQNAFALQLTVTRQSPIRSVAIDQQADPIALADQCIGHRGGSLDPMLEERTGARTDIAEGTAVEDQTDIGNPFLLELVDEQAVGGAGSGAGVDPAGWVTRLILAHTKEFNARAALARRDEARIDPRLPWPDIDSPHPGDLRQDKELAGRWQKEALAKESEVLACGHLHPWKVIDAALPPQRVLDFDRG